MNPFDEQVREATGEDLTCLDIDTIQVNIGLRCNLTCRHCHVASGPKRKEEMGWETMGAILDVARRVGAELVDITGGAPEMNPHFRRFVGALSEAGLKVQVRTNLTILLEPGFEDLAEFMRDHGVWLVASLPCYLEDNVDRQRGRGVHAGSIEALRELNRLGYGAREELPLTLVYNPIGPALPPSQTDLELDYRRELDRRFGIRFTRLIAITNMPIGRFWADLRVEKRERDYMDLLRYSFNPGTLGGLMCRHQISVDWDGRLYDCDFNLALKLSVDHGAPDNIRRFDQSTLARRRIVTGDHCFGCTAGRGSSCDGVLV